ncbi:hypothetical protein A1O7_01501 [Cladophialophora yegresii CBS 114405]|uniref:3-beta hydroxysteroid dehydrogenase/isomerase domain-containing protein n=1 Tax=Cladophialophora yegresii CBS 114405 TaxID=1182544 RepID=W9WKL4_9EURO|nr:uncharacterized protein A1O7_01501 [Cladophialophora yegresii CBS 114405]EXJ65161.1 hypothetical protein A1O7_01501 [Cladophialophora yegresii CBS 114405]
MEEDAEGVPVQPNTDIKAPRVKVVVTGGLGFVGSAVVRALHEFHPDWHVWILDKCNHAPGELDLLRGCKYEYVQANITDGDSVMRALSLIEPDAVVHTAGIVPSLSERYARRLEALVHNTNVEGTRHMVDAASKCGCRAFVYTSSCCAVTDDMSKSYANIDETWPVAERSSVYGESKAAAERIVIAANKDPNPMATCVLRPCVVFGEGDDQLIPPIHACIAKGETRWVIGSATNLWDTVYVGNVADAHVLAVENLLQSETAAGETFFIQNNEPVSFRDFSLAVWKEFGHFPPAWEIPIPAGLGWVLGLLAEVFTRVSGTPTTLSRGSVMDACAMRYASGDKAKSILGYQPRVGLEDGIRWSCQVSRASQVLRIATLTEVMPIRSMRDA